MALSPPPSSPFWFFPINFFSHFSVSRLEKQKRKKMVRSGMKNGHGMVREREKKRERERESVCVCGNAHMERTVCF